MYNNFIRLVNELSEMGGKKLLSTPQKEVKSESEFRNKKKSILYTHNFFMNGRWKKSNKSKTETTIFFLLLPLPPPSMCIKLCNYTFSLATHCCSVCMHLQAASWMRSDVSSGGMKHEREEKIHSITATPMNAVWHMAGVYFILQFYCRSGMCRGC